MKGSNFRQKQYIIHRILTWLKTSFSWIHYDATNNWYLDEYCFRV